MLTALVSRTAQQPPGGQAPGGASQSGAQGGPAGCHLAGMPTGTPHRQRRLSTAAVLPRRRLGEALESQSRAPEQPVGRPAEQQANKICDLDTDAELLQLYAGASCCRTCGAVEEVLWESLSMAEAAVSWHVSSAA